MCGEQIGLYSFTTQSAVNRHVLNQIGVESESPQIVPVCGPLLWEGCDEQKSEVVDTDPQWKVQHNWHQLTW